MDVDSPRKPDAPTGGVGQSATRHSHNCKTNQRQIVPRRRSSVSDLTTVIELADIVACSPYWATRSLLFRMRNSAESVFRLIPTDPFRAIPHFGRCHKLKAGNGSGGNYLSGPRTML